MSYFRLVNIVFISLCFSPSFLCFAEENLDKPFVGLISAIENENIEKIVEELYKLEKQERAYAEIALKHYLNDLRILATLEEESKANARKQLLLLHKKAALHHLNGYSEFLVGFESDYLVNHEQESPIVSDAKPGPPCLQRLKKTLIGLSDESLLEVYTDLSTFSALTEIPDENKLSKSARDRIKKIKKSIVEQLREDILSMNFGNKYSDKDVCYLADLTEENQIGRALAAKCVISFIVHGSKDYRSFESQILKSDSSGMTQ